jgi:hypothetical protein
VVRLLAGCDRIADITEGPSRAEPIVGQPAMMMINGIIICAHSPPLEIAQHPARSAGCKIATAQQVKSAGSSYGGALVRISTSLYALLVKNEDYINIQQ